MKATTNKLINRFYEFDSFRIDARERILLRDGQPIPLLPKAFDTLLVLVQHSGEVLGSWLGIAAEEVATLKTEGVL